MAGFHAQLQYADKKSSSVCKILAGPLLNSSGSRNLKHFGNPKNGNLLRSPKVYGVLGPKKEEKNTWSDSRSISDGIALLLAMSPFSVRIIKVQLFALL